MMLSAMAACVGLVACVNVANLLLARSVSRQKQISIRAALSAARRHIVRQTASPRASCSGVIGGLAGLLLAIWGLDAMKRFLPSNIPLRLIRFRQTRVFSPSPPQRVSLWESSPAFCQPGAHRIRTSPARSREARAAPAKARTGGAFVQRWSRSRSCSRCCCSRPPACWCESFLRLQKVPPGFDRTERVYRARRVARHDLLRKPAECAAFFDKLLKRVGQSPGVNHASAAWWIPLSGSEITLTTDIQEHPLPKASSPPSGQCSSRPISSKHCACRRCAAATSLNATTSTRRRSLSSRRAS